MAISKSLRYEILRRDGIACRYCGATASNDGVKLVVDHVTPETLGGATEPSNLVAACESYNQGKSSTPPDAEVVGDVIQAAAEWRAAMELAAEELDGRTSERMDAVRRVDEVWSRWTTANGTKPVYRPNNWAKSIENFLTAGLSVAKLEELVLVAMNSKADADGTWRYFCKCCWNTIRAIQDRAVEILADKPEPEQEFGDDEHRPGFLMYPGLPELDVIDDFGDFEVET